MDDFCDCAQCPHHCGGNEEEVSPAGKENVEATTPSNSNEASCDEDASSLAKASANEKVDKLKKAIQALGFKLEDTKEGIKVTM